MRIRASHFRALGRAALLFACTLTPLTAAQSSSPTAKQIDDIFSAVAARGDPGLAVLVRKDGSTALKRGYGMRDLRCGLPIDEHTNFRLASFTKQFTAMAVMLLVHDGKLRYDEPLTDIFPEFPAYGNKITVRNLLNHTSGLEDYERLWSAEYAGKSPDQIPQIHDATVLALMEKQSGTKFPPGANWEYSNSGYVVLGMVVQKASGIPFGQFLRERIFAPLGMRTTVAYEYGKNQVPNRAYGYTRTGGEWMETDQSPTSATLGDGGIYTSIDDLIHWDDALRNHTPLSEQEMRPAITPVVLPEGAQHPPEGPDGEPVSYGFGWFLNPYLGYRRMWHYGSSVGFRTAIERFPDDNLTIIVLCNRTDLNPSRLALKVADLYLSRGR